MHKYRFKCNFRKQIHEKDPENTVYTAVTFNKTSRFIARLYPKDSSFLIQVTVILFLYHEEKLMRLRKAEISFGVSA